MTTHKQLFGHDPENGIFGDCFRTALACILDMEPCAVPHFFDGGKSSNDAFRELGPWLRGHSLALFELPMHGESKLEDILGSICAHSPGLFYLLTGESTSGINHTVVCYGKHVVCDPYIGGPNDEALIGPAEDGLWFVGVLTPFI